jgi:hypothetical protein
MTKLIKTLTLGATTEAAFAAAKRKKVPGGSAEPFEKARFGRENPRKSKLFPLIFFGPAWPGFAGFG